MCIYETITETFFEFYNIDLNSRSVHCAHLPVSSDLTIGLHSNCEGKCVFDNNSSLLHALKRLRGYAGLGNTTLGCHNQASIVTQNRKWILLIPQSCYCARNTA